MNIIAYFSSFVNKNRGRYRKNFSLDEKTEDKNYRSENQVTQYTKIFAENLFVSNKNQRLIFRPECFYTHNDDYDAKRNTHVI